MYTLLGLALLMSSCTKNQKVTDWKELDLKGRVNSLKEVSYKAVVRFGNNEKDIRKRESNPHPIYDSYLIFNNKGNVIEKNQYLSDSSLLYKTIYIYDENNLLIEENKYFSNGSLNNQLTYKYDNKGNIIQKYEHVPWSAGAKVTLHDDKGSVIEETVFDSKSFGLAPY